MKFEIDSKRLRRVLSEGSHYSVLVREIVYGFLHLDGRTGVTTHAMDILVQSGVLKITKEEGDGKE
jgi:hypothetical protein